MSHEPLANCDDPSTWKHKDEQIDLPRLLALIEAHGGADGLDLHGCKITGVNLSYAALQPYISSWHQAEPPPWVYGVWGIKLEGAHLEHSQISTSNLKGANLLFAQLCHTVFVSCILDEASVVRASAKDMTIVFGSTREATFNNSDLRDSTLSTDLTGASFGGADMQGARLQNATLDGVDLRLSNLRRAMLHGAKFNKTKIRPGNLGGSVGEELVASGKQEMNYKISYFEAADVYLDLKANFSDLGYYDAVSWAYVKERQMEKMAYFQEWTRRGRGLFGNPIRWIPLLDPRRHSSRRWLRVWLATPRIRISFARWLRNWAYELLTGYGERPLNPVVGGALAIVGFAAGYFFTGAISNFIDALVFSLATFATFNLVDLQPEGRGVDIASSVEALLGIGVLALVVFTLGNRMSRS